MAEEEKKEKFPSNSYTTIRRREDVEASIAPAKPKELEKKSPIKEKKETFGDRIVRNFLNIDKEDLKNGLIFDVIIPEMINLVDGLLRQIFLGDSTGINRRPGRGGKRNGRYTSYNSIRDGANREAERRNDPTKQNFRRIQLTFYEEDRAYEVLDDLRESLEAAKANGSGYVTVKELYSLADFPTNWAMSKWGWRDLEDVSITKARDEIILEMPPAEVIERL